MVPRSTPCHPTIPTAPQMIPPESVVDSDAEISWVDCAEDGAAHLAEGDAHAALQQWKQGYGIATEFVQHDPRMAASINNLAIGHRMAGDFAQAEHQYRLALEAWDAVVEWVKNMQLPARARSSLYHLRLELRHREQYRRHYMDEFQHNLAAGHAASLNNLAELLHAAGRLDDARELYAGALRERNAALPDDEPGCQVIAGNLALLSGALAPRTNPARSPVCAGAQPFSEQAEQNRWVVDLPTVFTDEGRLMAALLCAYVVDHTSAAEVGSSK